MTIDQAAGQVDPTTGSSIVFDVVFSEPVTGFATGDVTLGGSARRDHRHGLGWSDDLHGLGRRHGHRGDVTVVDRRRCRRRHRPQPERGVDVHRRHGHLGVGCDVTDPTVTIDQGAGQVDPTTGSSIVFDVVFSEPVTGFVTGDVTLGGTAGATTAEVSGGPTAYTVTVDGHGRRW